MLPSILERKFFAVESKLLRILSIVASYVKSKCRALVEEQIMSKDKYPSIFSPQMEAIVFIILQIFLEHT